ncbi:hypothetical protein BGZ80_010321 [Entomortierella chlamydospora]|uniref:Methyltransferase domain-containing protein n=1 Tax=Entomortierella chlamydospora TaxID=101097 RepID=A0A9P6MV76_9FUNG|nr:hypothetical protein BGZ79_003102 [Entomortierella chlamydospora]KAG0014647.1 hypothetical protein BGZ80_010321 [Entomortierella chlamydospora]
MPAEPQQGIAPEHEEEYDRYKDNPDLLGEEIPKVKRFFSFDWANGFISPFRPTPQDVLSNLFGNIKFSTPGKDSLLDLGCGDGLVLLQALQTFPQSQLVRAVGVDLDRPLLEAARDKILQSKSMTIEDPDSSHSTSNYNDTIESDILPRLELYHGDLLDKDEALSSIITPSMTRETAIDKPMTMRRLVQDCSHIFVYLLPEALSKLVPLLLESLEQGKFVLSMQWEIPELKRYQTYGDADQRYYIYSPKA